MLSRRFLRIKVIKSLYSHLKSEGTPLSVATKNLTNSIDSTYQLYFKMLALVPALAEYARERIEIGLNKKLPTYDDLHPNYRFVEGKVVSIFEHTEALTKRTEKEGLDWSAQPEVVRHIYEQMIQSDFYQKYMQAEGTSFRADLSVVEEIFVQCVQDNEMMEQALEEISIHWADDLDYVLTMVVRTLRALRPEAEQLALLPQFKNEDDEKFATDLFTRAVVAHSENIALLEKYTQNWDMERIAFMDIIILSVAITELTQFPYIPVKVSLDEYIEISRYYSTLGSPQFINGILDKAVTDLNESGKINKMGRGLL